MTRDADETQPGIPLAALRARTTERLDRVCMSIQWAAEIVAAWRSAGFHEDANVLEALTRSVVERANARRPT